MRDRRPSVANSVMLLRDMSYDQDEMSFCARFNDSENAPNDRGKGRKRMDMLLLMLLVPRSELRKWLVIKEMEPRGFEPLTSSMPLRRSTN
jgi:hypothetical protein